MLDRALLNYLSHGKLSVFVFHKVPPEADNLVPGELHLAAFERTLDFIVENFNVVPLEDAVTSLAGRSLTERTACITFDDGYADWLGGAVPLLERRNLHATFFITSGQYDEQPMWHERIANALRHAGGDEIVLRDSGLPRFPVATISQKRAAVAQLEQHLKYQSLAFRDEMLEQLESITGADPRTLRPMSVEALRELDNKGFAIGAHTVNHPILRFCDGESAKFELGAARETLEGIVGHRVAGFAYPNGRPRVDFSSHTIRLVKEAGYDYAVTTDWGVADVATPVHQIPRFTPWGPDPLKMKLQIIRNLMTKPVCLPE